MVFLGIGDWGGASDLQPTTAAEISNGMGMAASVSSILGVRERNHHHHHRHHHRNRTDHPRASFVLALGDNFYSAGIHGDAMHSDRFRETFEDVFTEMELDCPWYAIAGNHDHRGNVTAQIEYGTYSDRWTFPDINYTFTETLRTTTTTTTGGGGGGEVTTQVVYLDTVILAGMRYMDDETGLPAYEPHPLQSRRRSQLSWLEGVLKESTTDYLWVAGHYPIYSHCSHGPTDELISDVLPLMRTYEASGYISGHDHCLSHYTYDGVAFVVSGAGMECCYDPNHLNDERNPGRPTFRMDNGSNPEDARGGFASFEVTSESTIVRYHRDDGSVLYEAEPVPPRGRRDAAEDGEEYAIE